MPNIRSLGLPTPADNIRAMGSPVDTFFKAYNMARRNSEEEQQRSDLKAARSAGMILQHMDQFKDDERRYSAVYNLYSQSPEIQTIMQKANIPWRALAPDVSVISDADRMRLAKRTGEETMARGLAAQGYNLPEQRRLEEEKAVSSALAGEAAYETPVKDAEGNTIQLGRLKTNREDERELENYEGKAKISAELDMQKALNETAFVFNDRGDDVIPMTKRDALAANKQSYDEPEIRREMEKKDKYQGLNVLLTPALETDPDIIQQTIMDAFKSNVPMVNNGQAGGTEGTINDWIKNYRYGSPQRKGRIDDEYTTAMSLVSGKLSMKNAGDSKEGMLARQAALDSLKYSPYASMKRPAFKYDPISKNRVPVLKADGTQATETINIPSPYYYAVKLTDDGRFEMGAWEPPKKNKSSKKKSETKSTGRFGGSFNLPGMGLIKETSSEVGD